MEINHNYKTYFDNIHGFIPCSDLAVKFIDNPCFQRLRNLYQLGTTNYVFLGAIHTRFEHSIGTYYLAGRILKCINERTNEDLMHEYLFEIKELHNYFKRKNIKKFFLDDMICELIKISALYHDVGHGPFSHVFDDIFIPSVSKEDNIMNIHEYRSCYILEHVIKHTCSDLYQFIKDDEIQFMKNIINPTDNHKSFIYQIVSNNKNGIDVDKFDYIKRDARSVGLHYGYDCSRLVDDVYIINNSICYPKQSYMDIVNLFETRYRLHKTIYSHKTVISIQFMINDIMILLDPILKLSDSINDIKLFTEIDDRTIMCYPNFLLNHINKNIIIDNVINAKNIMDRINNRKLYKFIDTIVSKKKINVTWKNFNEIDNEILKEDIHIHIGKIGFYSGNKSNPLQNISFYNTKNIKKKSKENKSFTIKNNEISIILPEYQQEYILMIYSTNNNKKKNIENALIKIKLEKLKLK
ncbi:MAG: hypothetical protein CMF96_06915 [Candidatus Marinimicrobia bacterium]|nr:hypothetical protein [Candidatus Neomarinimicrobiota bacterium]